MSAVKTRWHWLRLELIGHRLPRAVQNRARYVIERSCAQLLSSFIRRHLTAQPILIIQILWLIVWFFDKASPKRVILLRWLHRLNVLCYLEWILVLVVVWLEELLWARWTAIHVNTSIADSAIVVLVALLLPQWNHLIIIFWVALLVLWHLFLKER